MPDPDERREAAREKAKETKAWHVLTAGGLTAADRDVAFELVIAAYDAALRDERADDMCVCGHTRHWHGAGKWACAAAGPDEPDGECRCSMFEDIHDPRCPGDCGPCGGEGSGPPGACLTCGGDGKCPGCSTAYKLCIARRELAEVRAALGEQAEGETERLRKTLENIAYAREFPGDEKGALKGCRNAARAGSGHAPATGVGKPRSQPRLNPLQRYQRGRQIAEMRSRKKPVAWKTIAHGRLIGPVVERELSKLDVAITERDGLADALEKAEQQREQLREVALAAGQRLGDDGHWAVQQAESIGRFRG